jgi:predicted 3-demethylubiquinone-9 3-methyltransferase (glyoxalase superfamily)
MSHKQLERSVGLVRPGRLLTNSSDNPFMQDHRHGDHRRGTGTSVRTFTSSLDDASKHQSRTTGQPFVGLKGGSEFTFDEAVSFQVFTDAGGDGPLLECHRRWRRPGERVRRCRDKFGLSWQIVPRALTEAINDPDTAAAKHKKRVELIVRTPGSATIWTHAR